MAMLVSLIFHRRRRCRGKRRYRRCHRRCYRYRRLRHNRRFHLHQLIVVFSISFDVNVIVFVFVVVVFIVIVVFQDPRSLSLSSLSSFS